MPASAPPPAAPPDPGGAAKDPPSPGPRIGRGSRAFWRANVALFLAAFSVFALLYSVQPLLPVFAAEFRVDAGTSSLSLSLSTAMLAVCLLLASWLADRWGRKTVIVVSLLVAAALGLLVVAAPDWPSHLVLRTLLGIALAGVPAVAMVYLAEEMEPEAFGFSMGLYIGGNAIGGMSGRLLVGLLADVAGWRVALLALGLVVLASAGLIWWLLPAPRHSPSRQVDAAAFLGAIRRQFRDRGLPWLFAEAFLVMGGFVALYNYTGFRLLEPPHELSQAAISLIFLVYLIGTGASTWIGALAQRLGRRRVLWLMIVIMAVGLAINCLPSTAAVIGGMVVVTFGFFGAHSIASSWVGRRARDGKAQATALYLFFYYLGSSTIGTLGGYAWNHWAWTGVALVIGATILAALLISIRLFFLPPLPVKEEPPPAPA